MTTQSSTSQHVAEARRIGSALAAAARLMDEGSSFSFSVHGLPVEAFDDRRVSNVRLHSRKGRGPWLAGDFTAGQTTVAIHSVPIGAAEAPAESAA